MHISVGDLLRDEVKNGTAAGKKAKSFMDSGPLVPDEVVVEMVKTRLAQPDVQRAGWLLDGYPRSASQAEAIEKEGIRPDVFLLINVSQPRCCSSPHRHHHTLHTAQLSLTPPVRGQTHRCPTRCLSSVLWGAD